MAVLSIWVPWAIIKPAYALPAPVTTLPASAQPLEIVFERGIQLLAYETPESSRVSPGELLPITVYWRGEQPLETDYTVFVHLVDEYGLIVAQRDIFHGPGVYPTSQWLAGQIFGDTYILKIPHTAFAPTQAEFMVGLYDHTTGSRLLTSTGADHVRFGQINLEPQPGDLPNPQQLLFEDGIRLVGYNLDQRRVARGTQVRLTLYWQGQAEPAKNYKVFVHLVNSQEIRAAQHDSEPANGAAPTSSWRLGETIIDEHSLTIVPDAAPGSYRLLIGLYEGDSGKRLRLLRNHGTPVQADVVTLGGIQVVSP